MRGGRRGLLCGAGLQPPNLLRGCRRQLRIRPGLLQRGVHQPSLHLRGGGTRLQRLLGLLRRADLRGLALRGVLRPAGKHLLSGLRLLQPELRSRKVRLFVHQPGVRGRCRLLQQCAVQRRDLLRGTPPRLRVVQRLLLRRNLRRRRLLRVAVGAVPGWRRLLQRPALHQGFVLLGQR